MAAADAVRPHPIESFSDILQLSITILKEFEPNKESVSSFMNNFLRPLSALDATHRCTIEQIVEGVLRHKVLLNSLVDDMNISFFANKEEPLKMKVFFWILVCRLGDLAERFASFVAALQLRTALLLKLADFIFSNGDFFETTLKQHFDHTFVNEKVLSTLQSHQVRRHLLDAASKTEEHNRSGRSLQANTGATLRKLSTKCEPFAFTERLRPKLVDVNAPQPPPTDDRDAKRRQRRRTTSSPITSLEQLEQKRLEQRQQALANLVAKHAAHRRFVLSDRKRECKANNVEQSDAGERHSVSRKPSSHPKTTTTSTLRQALVLEREAERRCQLKEAMSDEDGGLQAACAERERQAAIGQQPEQLQRRRQCVEREKRELARTQIQQYQQDKEVNYCATGDDKH